jgi:hypothetical protein
MKFVDVIHKFMDIVLAVQTELRTRLVGGKRGRFSTAASPSKPSTKQARVAPRGGKPSDLNDSFTLARKLGLCFGCGQLYPKGRDGRPYDRVAHDRGCRKKFLCVELLLTSSPLVFPSGAPCIPVVCILSRTWLKWPTPRERHQHEMRSLCVLLQGL